MVAAVAAAAAVVAAPVAAADEASDLAWCASMGVPWDECWAYGTGG
jgi:hypothetical protein